jgi:hypothetical protein
MRRLLLGLGFIAEFGTVKGLTFYFPSKSSPFALRAFFKSPFAAYFIPGNKMVFEPIICG